MTSSSQTVKAQWMLALPTIASSSLLISTELTLKILTLNELHPVEGPELSKVTAEDPAPLVCGQHTVPPLGVYIKGEEEIKKEKEDRRKGKRWEEGWGQALRENKAEGIYARSVTGRGGRGRACPCAPPTRALRAQLSQAGPQGSRQVTSWWTLQQGRGSHRRCC